MGAPAAGPDRIPLVAVDANLLDRDGTARDALVDALLAAVAAGRLRLFVPSGVMAEMRDVGAPEAVRALAAVLPAPPPAAPPTARQHIDRIRVRAILRGDGRPGKHDADAAHLSEAAEAGCSAFLTRDGKVLRRRDALRPALPPGLRIATLDAFMTDFGSRPPFRDGPAGPMKFPFRSTRPAPRHDDPGPPGPSPARRR